MFRKTINKLNRVYKRVLKYKLGPNLNNTLKTIDYMIKEILKENEKRMRN